ncbi:hypothetical protein ACFELO_00650 [Oceanicaulis sp. LC35]|uniref:hypothetical protein n=1 Tax=Oceanicaulis sp. LC35 TaxID=3349635 RepID=UPI003F863E88
MELIEAAERFRIWAAKTGVLTYTLPEDELDNDPADLEELFDNDRARAASDALVKSRINMVFVNRADSKIVVCTHRKLTKAALEALPRETEEGFPISYIKAMPPSVKSPSSTPSPNGHYLIDPNSKFTCGGSISAANELAAGTLGCLVNGADGKIFGLSNNHVTGGCSYLEPEFPILAPGLADIRHDGISPFTLGRHTRVSPWISGSPSNVDISGNFDAALFEVEDTSRVSSMQRNFFDTPIRASDPSDNLPVKKVGRTTGLTNGKVIGWTQSPLPVAYQVPEFKGAIYFEDIWIVRGFGGVPFSAPGDSGSLVVTELPSGEHEAVGLVFAGTNDQSLSFIIPINKILSYFDVTLAGELGV